MHPFKTIVFLPILVSALITGTRIFSFAEVTQNQFYPALVEDISDSKYFAAVHSALQSAKSSIFVSLFGITISEHNEQSLPNILVQDLVEAHKRGVKVVVRLNKDFDFNPGDGNENSNPGNKLAYVNLVSAGIDCKIIAPGNFLHDKLIVIDEEIVIDGSANWTFHALRLNHESSSLIRSGEYAREKIARIKNLEVAEEKVDPQKIETVPISGQFLLDPRLGPYLIRSISVRGLEDKGVESSHFTGGRLGRVEEE